MTVPLRLHLTPARDGGGVVLSSPDLPGWAMHARGRDQLTSAVTVALREADCARYARMKGQGYDLEPLSEPSEPPPKMARWAASYHPTLWTDLGDGTWRSPTGRVYGAETQMVQRVQRRLDALQG